jgi:PBSX family phage terminase large subunit
MVSMNEKKILAPKQIEFILKSNAKVNIAAGAVRSGKTVCGVYRFLQSVHQAEERENHYMIGHTATTIKRNAVDMILSRPPPGYPDPFGIFRPFCTWLESKHELLFGDKIIHTCGVRDKGAIGLIQGATFANCYGDEMTLWDESIIDMVFTRLSRPYSRLFGTMNPTHPSHKIKQWIDWAEQGDKTYYAMHFNIDDNPFIDEAYKAGLRKSLSGVFYKRNYLGQWCLAEGAIFDFFDRSIHVVKRAPASAEYYIAGIDYGTANAFCCVLIGVSTGRANQAGKRLWVEREYYWDFRKTGRQKTATEFAIDVQRFLEPYGVRQIYLDPSALAFKLELQRLKMHPVNADNDVENGILIMTSEMQQGNLYIMEGCVNLIREVESYVWDPKSSEKGYDEPLKKDDHALDALRYAIATHKVSSFDVDEYYAKQNRPRFG